MKKIKEITTEYRVTKIFEIGLDDGRIIAVEKWVDDDNTLDHEICTKSQEIYNSLTEEQQEEVETFIEEECEL